MGDEEREEKLFSLSEAELLLPVIRQALTGAVQQKKQLEELEREFSQVQNRILLYGGILPPYRLLSEKKTERDALLAALRDSLLRIEQTGCIVKDLDTGLIDFLSVVNHEKVFLCWKLGEERIGYWHGIEEGFAGRKPLQAGDAAADDDKLN